jgi:cyclohexanone monooxygenase
MTNDAGFDRETIELRYEQERAKRLRKDGNDQWIEIRTEAAGFDRDFNADPDFTRDPLTEEVDALVIGAGISGLLTAIHLREHGVSNLRIVETGADFGGTWYWNRYPGLRCDIESYIYIPRLEDLGHVPSERYARGLEIREHMGRLAAHHGLYEKALMQTAVTRASWDEARHRWIVTTSRGDEIAARFIVGATGWLSSPKLPRLPGMDSFRGHSFHTSRWDFAYTGGDEYGNMTGLADKVVGLIGTGATAIQLVPMLQKSAKHVYVIQRTPSAVDVRDNGPTDPEWARSLEPGWTRRRRENFTAVLAGGDVEEDMVDDAWTTRVVVRKDGGPPDYADAEIEKMARIRARVDTIVRDTATAEGLKAWYHYGCKRPTFSDEYLAAFNEPNVTLVDTNGRGVERVTPDGVVVNGEEIALDCLIYSTGFDFQADYSKENGIEFVGRDGLTLSEYWAGGPLTMFGLQTRNFPNFFFLRMAQATAASNFTHTADEQGEHIAYLVSEALKRGAVAMEPTQEAQDRWVGDILATLPARRAFHLSCTPGYYNKEGEVSDYLGHFEFYPGSPLVYYDILKSFRDQGNLEGLELTYEQATATA